MAERTSNMTYEEYASFLVRNLQDPTEGLIIDAIRKAGGDDDDASRALEQVRDYLSNPQVDVADDPSAVLEEGKDVSDLPQDLSEGKTLDEIVDEGDNIFEEEAEDLGPETLGEIPDRIPEIEMDKSPGEVIDESSMQAQELNPEQVQMDGEELLTQISDMVNENPNTSNEDVTRRLQEWGVPGDKIKSFMEGLVGLRASHYILSKVVHSDVSYSDAARAVRELNPDMDAETLRQALANAGAAEIEIDEALADLPPEQMEDPLAMGMGEEMGGGSEWDAIAQEYVAQDPAMTPEALMEILQGEGASPEEAQAAADAALGGAEFEPQPEDVVQTPKGAARVARVHETLQGKLYQVISSDDSVEWYGENAISKYTPQKTASTGSIWQKIAAHMEEEWYTERKKLPVALKAGYEARLAQTLELRKQVQAAIVAGAEDEVELAKIDHALENEECHCKDKLKTAFSEDEAEYLVNLPTYSEGVAHGGSQWGPGGSVIAHAAAEAERAIAAIDWKHEATAGADIFVEDISSNLISDAGEVRRMAGRHIAAKTAALPDEQRRGIVNQFMQNVERARKAAAIEARKNGPVKEASVGLPEDFEKGLFF